MDSKETTNHRIGKVLNDRYKIVELIAEGSMGAVYKGERIQLKRPVAIKFLHALYHQDKEIVRRFEREAQAMSKLSHPFCVSVMDFGVDESPYIVMDFVGGETLDDALKGGRFEPARAIRLVLNILAGIGHAHTQAIVHRDIKPANIQISQDQGLGETVRIFDFGLAKLLDESIGSELSRSGTIMGTPNYMSPEQACATQTDERTDFYSIGIILYEMLSGSPPFAHESIIEVLKMHLEDKPPTLAERCSEQSFSPELEKVIEIALAKKPDQRFLTAAEFAEALSNVPEVTGSTTIDRGEENTPSSPEGASTKRSSQKPFAVWTHPGMGILVVAVLLVGTFVLWGVPPQFEEFFETNNFEALFSGKPSSSTTTKDATQKQKLSPMSKAELDALKRKAEAYAAVGNIDQAIEEFKLLRRFDPNEPVYIFRLANLFFQTKWWGDSMDHYEESIRIEKNYAVNTVLIQNVIDMLQPKQLGRRAYKLLLEQVGETALPQLEKASIQHNSPQVRQRARKLLDELSN